MGGIALGSALFGIAPDMEVIAIRLCDQGKACQRITDIRVKAQSLLGPEKDLSIEDAIAQIENNQTRFYVHKTERIYVRVVANNGKKYLRTEQNDTEDDNLLRLPTF